MAFREEIEEKYTWEIGSVEREKAKCFSNSDELKLRYERATEFRENQYQETCARQAKAWEMWDLRTVRNDFLRLGDYKDCAQRAKECYQKLNQLERENRQRLQWRNSGLCSHCGGNFKGIFAPKCTSCGKVKDY